MPHRLFLELQAFKPSLTLTSTKRTLHGVEGSQLRVRGIAVVDVKFTGQYILVPFTVVDIIDEVILGMDFLRQNAVTWDVAKGELHFQEGGTVGKIPICTSLLGSPLRSLNRLSGRTPRRPLKLSCR